jgi:vancomycin permeability regulator SanA
VADVPETEYTLVFGASVYGNSVSDILANRLDKAVEIYRSGKTKKIIVSGDNRAKDYNEVKAMKDYLIEKNIPEDAILADRSGIDTYMSVSHAKENLSSNKIIMISQKLHLIRAMYIAKKLKIDAYGVSCGEYSEDEEEYQKTREFFARIKAFMECDLRIRENYSRLKAFIGYDLKTTEIYKKLKMFINTI